MSYGQQSANGGAKGRFSNSGFKGKAQPAEGAAQKKEPKPTTHYMVIAKEKGEPIEFVPGVFIRETPHGFSLSVAQDAMIPPGNYFVNKKKDKTA